MDSRSHHLPRLVIVAALTLSASLALAIPKAAEDENGTVSIAPDVARPKVSPKSAQPAAKPAAKQSAPTAKKAKTAKPAAKGGKSSSVSAGTKPKHQKPAHGKK